jgi:hypothetical protein
MRVAKEDPNFNVFWDDIVDDPELRDNRVIIAQAETDVISGESGDWFANAKLELKNAGLETKLRNEEVTKAYDAYHTVLTDEVARAKKQASEDLNNPFYEMTLDKAKTEMGKSIVKVQEDIDVEAQRIRKAMGESEAKFVDDFDSLETDSERMTV